MIETLHSLRFVFIMLIVVSHLVGSKFDFGGECGVSFFFILSGFVLSYAYGEKVKTGQFRIWSFLRRQLLKFYPLHLLMLVGIALIDVDQDCCYDWQHVMPCILLLQSWIPFEEYIFATNGLSWFLCDILFFYLVFAACYRFLNRLSVRMMSVVGGMALVAYVAVAWSIPHSFINSVLYASPWMRLLDFCIGMLLCRLLLSAVGADAARWMQRQSKTVLTLCELLVVALVVLSYITYLPSSPRFRCVALFWLVIPPVLSWFFLSDRHGGWLTALLKTPVMLWLGSISMEIYLTHIFVFRSVFSVLRAVGVTKAYVLMAIGVAVLLPVCYLTKRFFVDKIYASLLKYV